MSAPAAVASQQYTHPNRRDNQSMSSTHSRNGSRSQPAVESAVTRLLVSIKQLLESLALWSNLKVNETEVSDVYVRLGNDFNAAVAAFGQFNIDMTELMTVPQDLREVLERCLSEDATPANLEIYLPTVRKIITNLLQGLRNKQSVYRRIVSERRHRSDTQGHDRTDSRSSKASKTESTTSVPSRYPTREGTEDTLGYTRSGTPEERRRRASSRRREAREQPTGVPPPPPSQNEDYFGGGFRPPLPSAAESSRRIPVNGTPPVAYPDLPPQATSSREELSRPPPSALPNDEPPENPLGSPAITSPRVPPNVTRYSLIDKPVPPPEPAPVQQGSIDKAANDVVPSMVVPSVVVDPVSPVQSEGPMASLNLNGSLASLADTPSPDAMQAPAMASSLAALKKSEALERRASKRFSTYNISKITGGGGIRERFGSGRTKRRSMAVESSNLTPGDLDVLTEVDEAPPTKRDTTRSRSNESGGASRSRATTPRDDMAPPLPTIPAEVTPETLSVPLPEDKPPAVPGKDVPRESATASDQGSPQISSTGPVSLTVFLQLGRVVKKVTIDPEISFSSLRVLFVDKFSYSPGQGNFPAIYIRDPSSGVMYELEDVYEVKDKCLLSLNVEPLDQVKQHIDTQMANLTSELRELRSAVNSSRRMSHSPPQAPPAPTASDTTNNSLSRPSEKQWQMIARRVSHIVSPEASSPRKALTPGSPLQQQTVAGPEASGRIVADLKTQFDEVQNLRRDLGVMRQMYTDFISQTKDSIGVLRTQTQSVRQLADTKVGGARAYINSGKAKLDSRSQNVLTRVEELQDTVENLKDDVLKRHISPKATLMKQVIGDINEVAAELSSLKEYISTIKPMWKKTWEEELQNIVEEQQFLTHQEEFMSDLLDDHKALMEVFGHVEKVVSLRSNGMARTRGFKPPPIDENHGGISTVMMEIRGASVDPERRLKAIAANQKNREKELANKSDEFESELKGFVGGKKLKMTGGAEEVERVRQKRNDLALKAMFNNANGNMSSPSLGSGSVDGSFI